MVIMYSKHYYVWEWVEYSFVPCNEKRQKQTFFLNRTLVSAISSCNQQVVSNSITFLLFASDYWGFFFLACTAHTKLPFSPPTLSHFLFLFFFLISVSDFLSPFLSFCFFLSFTPTYTQTISQGSFLIIYF